LYDDSTISYPTLCDIDHLGRLLTRSKPKSEWIIGKEMDECDTNAEEGASFEHLFLSHD
jgi:hypothetical protein